MSAPLPRPPALRLPQPAVALPEENAGLLAAAIYSAAIRERAEALDRLEHLRRDTARLPVEPGPVGGDKRNNGPLGPVVRLSRRLKPWLARKFRLG